MRRLVLLGSTGSIGVNTLDCVRRLSRAGERWSLRGLSAFSNLEKLKDQIREFRPPRAVVGTDEGAIALRAWLRSRRIACRVDVGVEGLVDLAREASADLVVSAVVGSVGLRPLLAAVQAGKKIALANKEALIVAGDLLMKAARRHGAELLPIDSEHSAIFQCLNGAGPRSVRRLILTASGGAFYRRSGSLDTVTPREALDHPTWKMGKKITVDCATLTNKGLEAIEAHHLFQVPLDRIDIVVHPQSIVHSLVEFNDGAVLAQLSHPDMRLPIQYALTHPERRPTPLKTLRLEEMGRLDFHRPDFGRFPSLSLALAAGRRGGTWPAVFNGANEVAVHAFLNGELSFTGIPTLCRRVLTAHRPASRTPGEDAGLSAILRADSWAREKARTLIDREKK
jgi:1-deoxy-D-xylulose-5-phosphate reductoisomerase